jgi:hypothetical protein
MIDVEWDLLPRIGLGPFGGFFGVIPYFWLLVAGLFFTFVYFDFRNIKGGYRHGGVIIISVSLITSVLVGTCIYFLRTPEYAEGLFRRIPMYQQLHMGHEMMWNVPGGGVLAGTILELSGDKIIILKDFGEDVWVVDISRASIVNGPRMVVGMEIRAVGKIVGPGKFFAEGIRFPKREMRSR